MHDFQHSDSERVCRSWHLWLYFLPFSRLPQWHSNRLSQILLRKWKFGIYIYRIYHNGNHLCNSWTDYLLRKAQKKSQLKKELHGKTMRGQKTFMAFIYFLFSILFRKKHISLSYAFCSSAWWNWQKAFLFPNGVKVYYLSLLKSSSFYLGERWYNRYST